MKKILLLSAFLLATSAVFAQQQKGDVQIQGLASYTNLDGAETGIIFFSGSKFVTDHVEIGVQPIVIISAFSSLNLGIFSNYSFLTSDAKMVPYAGAGLYFYDLGGDFGSTGFTIKGGLRYFITEQINIDAGPSMTFLEGANLFTLNVGLGILFGPGH